MFLPVGDEVRKAFFPVVTVLLIVVHIATFFYFREPDPSMASASIAELSSRWGIENTVIPNSNWEQALTYWVFDKSIFSLAATVFALVIFGPTLENRTGRLLFGILYIVNASLAGLAYCALEKNGVPYIGSAGAAGGLIGCYSLLVGLGTRIRSIFFWGMSDVPAFVVFGMWGAAQYGLATHALADTAISPLELVVPSVMVGALLGLLAIPLAENKIVVLRGEKWISADGEKPGSAAMEAEEGVRRGTRCPCCKVDLTDTIRQNAEAEFYYCPNNSCKRLVFRTNLV